MKNKDLYQINPGIAWISESDGNIALILPGRNDTICLGGLEAILWRTLWQRLPPNLWEKVFTQQGQDLAQVIQNWVKSGLITEVKS